MPTPPQARQLPTCFTFDLEDHTHTYAPNGRWVFNTQHLLDWLEARSIRGTFFALGRVAQVQPALLRDIVKRGHEVACHSLAHKPLPTLTPQDFSADTRAAKFALEDATGKTILGYRAPYFSLDERTLWAPEILSQQGFVYSSSVMPALPGALGKLFKPYRLVGSPQVPFVWPGGLVELPVPQRDLGPLTIPYLGGIYMRYLPLWWLKRWVSNRQAHHLTWTYLHPYDHDDQEAFSWGMHGSPTYNVLLWLRRGDTLPRLDVLVNHTSVPLGQWVSDPTLKAQLGVLPTWPSPQH